MAPRIDRKAVILQSEVRALKKALTKFGQPQGAVKRALDQLEATFAAYEPNKVEQAIAEYHRDGEIEIDEGAVCSRGDDDGCYVQAWVWVYDKGRARC